MARKVGENLEDCGLTETKGRKCFKEEMVWTTETDAEESSNEIRIGKDLLDLRSCFWAMPKTETMKK